MMLVVMVVVVARRRVRTEQGRRRCYSGCEGRGGRGRRAGMPVVMLLNRVGGLQN